ncbi:G patch domain-containing protein 1-like isoform X1 [Centruroides sculpturatus]|uniref:G patch domain-containing protein 1-like isoform X1 n=2 Tax=Centruroides sculpturatus TaxID=218467 RepID=UPI000C6E6E25|nr:G patch domain-containing protein 1-like isoform X1 [Centruroides sculpturatus]
MASDDEDFVTYGTPLEPLEDDEAPPSKIPVHEQTVHDEKGRRRFHGAFTGGFSAGYFNTVGSKEGWAPSAFQSSRSQKADKFKQNPEDFMDNEDLGVFGIASRRVQTTDNFSYKEEESRKRNFPVFSSGPIPGVPPLKELVKPVRETIGVRLLQKMGWKQGQGIGPRIEKKQKQVSSDGKKIYGCALPPTEDENDDDDDDPYAIGHTFAPKDIEILPYVPKNNLQGIGYSGLNKNPVLSSHINLFEPTHTATILEKKKKLLISGQAFGVGAFEDEDDDIYAKDDMTQYDYFLEGTSNKQDTKEKPKRKNENKEEMIEGFCLAIKSLLRKKNYPPPSLPPNFRPIHQPKHNPLQKQTLLDNQFLDRHNMNAYERNAVLTEESSSTDKCSVFDLLSTHDKQRLEQVKKQIQEKGQTLQDKQITTQETQKLECEKMQEIISVSSKEKQNQCFKPFQNDKAKQARYEQYLTLMKIEKKDCLEQLQPKSMTEWEKQREKEEFQRAAILYRPLSSTLNSRFISSSILENDREIEIRVDEESDQNDQKKAAEMKMFGKLTREKFEWHPAKVLCKRFNVPNPYSDCTMVGLPKVKRDRYSLFNFLTVPTESNLPKPIDTSSQSQETVSSEPIQKEIRIIDGHSVKEEKHKKETKKLLTLEKKDDDGRPSMDLFKAIFQNTSSEDSNSSEEEVSKGKNTLVSNALDSSQNESNVNVTNASSSNENSKKTVPAFGIFANIDLIAINQQKDIESNVDKKMNEHFSNKTQNPPTIETKKVENSENSFYGPKLPPTLLKSTSDEDKKKKEKVYYKKNKKDKHHKHKHKSKSKKTKHKHKLKHKKLNQKSTSSSENTSESETEMPSNFQILQKLHQLQRLKDL